MNNSSEIQLRQVIESPMDWSAFPLGIAIGLILTAWVGVRLLALYRNRPRAKPPVHSGEFEDRVGRMLERRESRVAFDFRKDDTGAYKDPRTRQAYSSFKEAPPQSRTSDDFLLSLAVGYATNSTMVGWAAGGSLLGGMAGAALSEGHGARNSDAYERAYESESTERASTSWSDSKISCDRPVESPYEAGCSVSDDSSTSGGDSNPGE